MTNVERYLVLWAREQRDMDPDNPENGALWDEQDRLWDRLTMKERKEVIARTRGVLTPADSPPTVAP